MAKLIIRVNGGTSIGMGHFFRTLSIAKMMREKFPVSVTYLINKEDSLSHILQQEAFPFYALSDAKPSRSALEKIVIEEGLKRSTVILIDSKWDVSEEITLYRSHGIPVVLMDNVTEARLLANLNIYPSAHFPFSTLDWDHCHGNVMGGSDWIPLQENFLNVRSHLIPIQERKNVLITMGGSDLNRLTLRIMDALKELVGQIPIQIVLGFTCTFKEEVSRKNSQYRNRFQILEDVLDMERLMAGAGLAITALGTTIYELAYLGVPTIVLSNYPEDGRDEEAFKKLGCLIPLGYHKNISNEDIREATSSLWSNIPKREEISQKAFQITDGYGVERICGEIQKLLC